MLGITVCATSTIVYERCVWRTLTVTIYAHLVTRTIGAVGTFFAHAINTRLAV